MTFVPAEAEWWIGLLAGSALKSSVILGIALVASLALRRRSAALRHLVWAVALASLLAIPALSLLLPSWQPELAAVRAWSGAAAAPSPEATSDLPAMTVRAVLSGDRKPALAPALLLAWAAGFLLCSTMLLVSMVRLALVAARSKPLFLPRWMRLAADISSNFGLSTPVRLLRAPKAAMPATWGVLRPRVLLPEGAENWPEERMRVVLAHELAHVRRGDWLLQMLAEILRAVYWFHPLVWMGCSRLRQEGERACDDAVLTFGVDGPAYAEHLLALARMFNSSDRAWSAALAMARPTNLERRFIAMLSPSLNRRSVSGTTVLAATLVALGLIAPLAALQAPVPSASGKFSGTVLDASGAAIPNATVIVSNQAAKTKDMTVTGATGVFEFTGLAAGTYTLEVLKPGFRRFVEPEVKLRAAENLARQFVLEIGSVTEQINVIAEAQGRKTPASPEPGVLAIGGSVQQSKLLHMARPAYPPVAKAAGIEGAVLLEAVITKEGGVQSLRVMNTQLDPELAKAAVEAVSQWRYQPTLLNGQPVDVITNITVNFQLAR